MNSLPPPLGSGELVFWRLDKGHYASTWNTGEGSFQVGGRWNSKGVRAIYASVDPSIAVLEVAVHSGFRTLNIREHVLTRAKIFDPNVVHVVQPEDIPNPNWLRPTAMNSDQQAFGDQLLSAHRFVCIPSAVSTNSWNLIFDAAKDPSDYGDIRQEKYALDPRLAEVRS